MEKIEIHCHVLPELDDGSQSMEESLKMLRSARKQGIYKLIATPHYSHEFPNENPEQIRALCFQLEQRARKEIDDKMRIYPGQEIFYGQDVAEKLNQGKLLTLAETKYVLLEFLPGVPYSVIYAAVREMTMFQYQPILAHIERYGVLREPGRLDELVEAGAYLQMNYRRIGGKWYDNTTHWCRKILKQRKIHFLSTDMHNIGSRKPDTRDAQYWMEKHLDNGYQKKICYGNAVHIIKNKESLRKEEGR